MKKKLIAIGIISLFLLTGFSSLPVVGAEADEENEIDTTNFSKILSSRPLLYRILSKLLKNNLFQYLLAALPSVEGGNQKSVKEAAETAEEQLLSVVDGVNGISYTEDPEKVIVYLEDEKYKDNVPDEIDGYETEIRVIGRLEALTIAKFETPLLSQNGNPRHEYHGTTKGGISVGTYQLEDSYGTLSVVVAPDPDWYILSNTHVIAQDMNGNHLLPGKIIVQPGLYHGGGPLIGIGYLHKYIKIKYNGEVNYADAAIATLNNAATANSILGADDKSCYNVDLHPVSPSVGKTVRKSGATTGVTENEITDTHATCTVYYSMAKSALFKDVILVDQPFLEPGDSGSFVDYNSDFVGLAFAGSSEAAIVCKAEYIVEEFNLLSRNRAR